MQTLQTFLALQFFFQKSIDIFQQLRYIKHMPNNIK